MEDRYQEIGFVQQILGLNLVPRRNGTHRGNDTSLSDFSGWLMFLAFRLSVCCSCFHPEMSDSGQPALPRQKGIVCVSNLQNGRC